MIRIATGMSLALAMFLTASQTRAAACNTTGLWLDSVVCESEILKKLDADVTGRLDRLVSRLTAGAPELAAALAADQAAWRARRSSCKQNPLPQQCLEWQYYGRLETSAHLINLLDGPRRFGDPLRICWQRAEGEKDAQKCLDRHLADIRTGLGIIAKAVAQTLVKRDAAAGAAGDAVTTFEAAQSAFPPYADAVCSSEAAALGEGPGRALGETGCRIKAWQARAADILRFLPDLPVHWSNETQAMQEGLAICLAHAQDLKPGGPVRVTDIAKASGAARPSG